MMETKVYDKLFEDIEKIKQIPIVPTILEVICNSTGMGFAAIARVTEDRWIACSVRDEIQFGLEPGGELQIKTTICNEIRTSEKAVIIDHVAKDENYYQHHTPLMYGFQSYISVPIKLKSGEFFGTLCAIDPQPAQLNNAKTIGMFNLFADLISFHLQSLEVMQRSNHAVKELSRKLNDTAEENRQYQYISDHNLQEPLRKLRFFSNNLINSDSNDIEKIKDLAVKINSSAQRFSMMIKDVSALSRLHNDEAPFEQLDLNKVVADVCLQLQQPLAEKQSIIEVGDLPSISAVPLHIEQLFYHLISNAIKFSKKGIAPHIQIYSTKIDFDQTTHLSNPPDHSDYFEIKIQDNGVGIEKSQLNKIFEIFSTLNYNPNTDGFGVGLAYCRKIVSLHHGVISAQSTSGEGTSISVILPSKSLSNLF